MVGWWSSRFRDGGHENLTGSSGLPAGPRAAREHVDPGVRGHRSAGALEAASPHARRAPQAYFEGIWETNSFEGRRTEFLYVDTRVLYYRRPPEAAATPKRPHWSPGRRDGQIRDAGPRGARYASSADQRGGAHDFAVQQRSTCSPTTARGAFRQTPFRAAADWYVALSRRSGSGRQLHAARQPYQEFARATSRCGSRPVEPRRVPPPPAARAADLWMTAPLPLPTPIRAGRLLAGRRLVARDLPGFREQGRGLGVCRVPVRAGGAVRSYALAAICRRAARLGRAAARRDRKARAFRVQLSRVEPMRECPMEQIAQQIAEGWNRGPRARPVAASLAKLDADVDRILEKRRWILARARDPMRADSAHGASRRGPCRWLLLSPPRRHNDPFPRPIAAAFLLSLTDFDIYASATWKRPLHRSQELRHLLRDPLL